VCAGLALVAACVGSSSTSSLIPGAPTAGKCQLGASQTSVLVTEWPASEKANLEGLLGDGGAVAVAFSGCELRLVPECRLRGGYVWQRTTPASDVVEIRNETDLYSKLPLGAASLGAELRRSGSLLVETTVSGQYRLTGVTAAEVPNDGACARVTHLVNGLSLGAFMLSGGGEATGGASASIAYFGAGGRQSRNARLVRAAGQAQTCGEATTDAPPHTCASPLQVFLTPIPGRARP
jgi:hypothetical protein